MSKQFREPNAFGEGRASLRAAPPCSPDYAYKTIEEYEGIVGYKVGELFRAGWNMARTTNAHLGIQVNNSITGG